MSTTAVFAEVMVIGLEAVAWLLLLVLSLFDVSGLASAASSLQALTSLFVLGGAYVLGVIVDRVSDSLLGGFRNATTRRDARTIGRMRRAVLAEASPLTAFVEYQRSRMRLMRGTTLNLVIAVPVTTFFLMTSKTDAGTALVVDSMLLLGAVAAYYSYLRIGASQDSWLQLAAPADERQTHAGPGV